MSIIQTNSGTRWRLIPGARQTMIVTIRLIAELTEPIPSTSSAISQ